MENILREVDPIVTVPYWDWSLWSGEPWLNQVFYYGPLRGHFGGRVSQQALQRSREKDGAWLLPLIFLHLSNLQINLSDYERVERCTMGFWR